MLARLDVQASAYQRIKWLSLKFRISPQISTAVSGGYVAAFVQDPTDIVPDGEAGLNALTSQSHSVTKKWWEDSIINAPMPQELLFTNITGSELRWSSPGQFVLASDGKATSAGSLTVYLDWSVELSVPSLEKVGLEEFAIDINHYMGYIREGNVDPTIQNMRLAMFNKDVDGVPNRTPVDLRDAYPFLKIGEVFSFPAVYLPNTRLGSTSTDVEWARENSESYNMLRVVNVKSDAQQFQLLKPYDVSFVQFQTAVGIMSAAGETDYYALLAGPTKLDRVDGASSTGTRGEEFLAYKKGKKPVEEQIPLV